MPNHRDTESILIQREEGEAARKRLPRLRRWPSSPRMPPAPQNQPAATSGRLRTVLPPVLAFGKEKAPPLRLPGTLTATRLKITTVLNAAELLAIDVPNGKPRVILRIRLPDRTVTAEIAAKSLRKAQRAIRESGGDDIAVVLQGNLVTGDTITEAGISAQPKAAKPEPAS